MAANLKPPKSLDVNSATEWKRVIAAAKQSGYEPKSADRPLLLLYVQTWGINQRAFELMQKVGAVVKYPNGMPGSSPHYKVYMETSRQLRFMLSSLGCTPASRRFDGGPDEASKQPPRSGILSKLPDVHQYHCTFPLCSALLSTPGYCDRHKQTQQAEHAIRNRAYSQHVRDPEAKKFYNSAAWQHARGDVLADHPVCQRCNRSFAEHVHHIKPLRQCSDDEKTARANLMAVCQPCHNAIESETPTDQEEVYRPATQLLIEENETYFYDAEAAERPIRFIEKFLKHYEGKRWAGKPFVLLDWQKDRVIRPLFGWKHRDTGLRRFRERYLIGAKGMGKTPLDTGIGLFMLLGDGEPSPHVISMASSFEQANLTFGAGKAYIKENPLLQAHTDVRQFIIKTKKLGKWTTISGKPTGRSGSRPSCIIGDEVHEWSSATAQAFELITANLFKRSQPLLLLATNAAENKECMAGALHQRALKVLHGEIKDDTLLPVIFEAGPDLQWDSEDAAKASNPSLGAIVLWSQLAGELAKAKESPAKEAKYRRLYLSQWVQGSEKWLRMEQVAAAMGPVDPDQLRKLPLFVGLDLSLGDDLCAAIFLWTSSERYYVTSRFWCPKETASFYQVKEGIPYDQWIESGDLIALDETTITDEVQARIATDILELTKGHDVRAVAFDPYKATKVTTQLTLGGLTCIAKRQGYSVSPGCFEIERRLKAKQITIHPNAVLNFCASNVEVHSDRRGNIWPVKPNARGKYAGKRGAKIDGISALVTAASEAKLQDVNPEPPPFTGEGLASELEPDVN